MLVADGGIIGLEMATDYSTQGPRIDVVELLDGPMQGTDRDLVKVWDKIDAHRLDNVMLETKTVGAKATKAGVEVSFEGERATGSPQVDDLVLVAGGRRHIARKIGADKAGVAVTDPEVAWTGKTEEQCKAEGTKIGKAVFAWAASGRAIANGRDEGFTKLIFDEATHRVIGGRIGHCTALPSQKEK